MKTFVLFALIGAVAHAGVVHNPLGVYGVHETGASQVHRQEDGIGSYSFGYDEAHTSGGSFHKETGAPGVKVGSYGLHDADGRVRVVNYVADALGYRADIKTNEPGVDHFQDPAATAINKDHVVAAGAYGAPFAGVVAEHHKVVAPIYNAPIHHGLVAPVEKVIATPINTGAITEIVDHKIVAPAAYTTAVHHGVVAPVHHKVVTPGIYNAAIHHGIAAPIYKDFIDHKVVAPIYKDFVDHKIVAPFYKDFADYKIAAPIYKGFVDHKIVAPAAYTTAVHHGIDKVVAPIYSAGIENRIVAPVHHGIIAAPHYAQAIHHGVVTPAIHHGIGYGLGYASAIHGGLGYAGFLGHVGKYYNVAPIAKVY